MAQLPALASVGISTAVELVDVVAISVIAVVDFMAVDPGRLPEVLVEGHFAAAVDVVAVSYHLMVKFSGTVPVATLPALGHFFVAAVTPTGKLMWMWVLAMGCSAHPGVVVAVIVGVVRMFPSLVSLSLGVPAAVESVRVALPVRVPRFILSAGKGG